MKNLLHKEVNDHHILHFNALIFSGEVHMGLVLSKKAHAKILKIDPSKALAMSGVVAFFSHVDVDPSHYKEEPSIFAKNEVSDDQYFLIIIKNIILVCQPLLNGLYPFPVG